MNIELLFATLILFKTILLGGLILEFSEIFDSRYQKNINQYKRSYKWQRKTFHGLKR